MSNLEEKFKVWAQGPSQTEHDKCLNAEKAIKKAIAENSELAALDITIFAQGSYRNRTNVRNNSDVDVCVRLNSTFFPSYPDGTNRETFGNSEGSITFKDYKNLVQNALKKHFGATNVKRGNKAFNIRETTTRIDADAVAAMEYRKYFFKPTGGYDYLSGIAFDADDGKRIVNWPNQNFDNSQKKHTDTMKRYRKMVRIFKRMRDVMQGEGIPESEKIASCLIEALIWNVPNDKFNNLTYTEDVRNIIIEIYNKTKADLDCQNWTEVNNIKNLFKSGQPWTREQANKFIFATWKWCGFTS